MGRLHLDDLQHIDLDVMPMTGSAMITICFGDGYRGKFDKNFPLATSEDFITAPIRPARLMITAEMLRTAANQLEELSIKAATENAPIPAITEEDIASAQEAVYH